MTPARGGARALPVQTPVGTALRRRPINLPLSEGAELVDCTPMRACIDIQSAVTQRAGVGRYTKMLVEQLAATRGAHELELFYFDAKRKGEPFPVPGAHFRACRLVPGRMAQGLWKTLNWPPFHAFAGRADLYHFPNFTRPPLKRGRSVITVHDMAFLRLPETLEEKNRIYLQARMKPSVERANAIITVSHFTAHELTDLMGVPPSKLHAIHSGIDDDMMPPAPAAVIALRAKLGLDRPYLLMVGTLEPRKNIPFLVEVFERLEKFDGDLVIAGRPGWKYEPILQRLRASRCAARIKHIADLGEGELPTLYGGAELFVLPSLYEGFGFPPLESMACGVPAVVAPAGAMAEVCGDAALIIPGYDADAWATAVQRLLDNSAERADLRARGLAHVPKFRWHETARQTWKAYEAALAS